MGILQLLSKNVSFPGVSRQTQSINILFIFHLAKAISFQKIPICPNKAAKISHAAKNQRPQTLALNLSLTTLSLNWKIQVKVSELTMLLLLLGLMKNLYLRPNRVGEKRKLEKSCLNWDCDRLLELHA